MKHEFPDAFKKKPKPGPRRCCDKCRFLIIDGFKLVAVPSEKPQVPTRRPTMTKSLAESESEPKGAKSPSRPQKKDDDNKAKDKEPEERESKVTERESKTTDPKAKASVTTDNVSNLPFNQRCCVAGSMFPRASSGLYCEGHVNGTIVENEPVEEETKPKKKPMGMMMGPAFGQPMVGMNNLSELKGALKKKPHSRC